MIFVEIVIIALALIGHTAFWNGLVNRIHGTSLPKWAIEAISAVCHSCLILVVGGYAWWFYVGGSAVATLDNLAWSTGLGSSYLLLCMLWTFVVGINWRHMRHADRSGGMLLANHTSACDLSTAGGSKPVGNRGARLLACLPGNQIFDLQIQEKELRIPRLAPELDGLSIAHLSDLHCYGGLTKAFFEQVVEQTNQLNADIIVITGDLFDSKQCLEWIDETFARLQCRLGVYYILGNHDLLVGDVPEIRRRLDQAGLIDVGGRWLTIRVQGQSILLAGNELPWHGPAAAMETFHHDDEDQPLRILLSHAPDQINWARRWDFDLMLAGHTHGGQICLPWIGPVVAPSRMGVRYASGVFYLTPTLMHVSRGIAGRLPLRLNCPPELAKLVLRAEA